jgi:hypothetical protein
MTIALQELRQRFAAAVHGAMSSADLLPLQDIQRAEDRLGQLEVDGHCGESCRGYRSEQHDLGMLESPVPLKKS